MSISNITKILIISFLLIASNNLFAQTKIRGTIYDEKTSEPVPFATISFKNSNTGTVTNYDGEFFLETNKKYDTLIINCIAYVSDTISVKIGIYQVINLRLKQESYNIDEIIILPGENPAHRILRNVIKNKRNNDPARFFSYSYEQYTKLRADINNIDPRIKDDKFMKNFSIVFEGLDTSSVTGKTYMPLLLLETLSDFYYQKFPRNKKEDIKAINSSGIKNASVTRFSGQMYLEMNFYENYIDVFDKQFVSPISFNSLMVYKYYLIDSAFVDNTWCYHITYKPKRKNEYTFFGDFWVADTTFALKSISANMSKTANIEFIESMYINHGFNLVNDSIWFPTTEQLFIDFNISGRTAGFFGRKYVSRKDVKINIDFPPKTFSKVQSREIALADDVFDNDTTFWNENRHSKLTVKEQAIHTMVDSVENTPAFKKVENFVYLISTGYLDVGKFEIGPYYYIYSKNLIEGNRFRIGGRTSNDFSKKIELSGHLAFGLKDQKLKYGAQVLYKLKAKQWTMLKLYYQNDMVQLGLSAGAFGSDNIFSSALSTTLNDKLLPVQDFEVGIERDIFKGLTTNLYFSHRDIFPTDSLPFIDFNNIEREKLSVSELSLNVHFGYNEETLGGNFNRLVAGSLYPIFEVALTHGIVDFWDGEYKYDKITLGMKHYMIFGPFGKLNYYVEAGKIFGKVPYPILKLHEGNQSYFSDIYAFNMMNYYEFASDKYASIFVEHHFQGLFLNKVPLLRRMHFREVIFTKAVIGSLSDENRLEFAFPGGLSDVSKPYIEAGLGIENIFKFIRVDGIWRLTHIENPETKQFGIRVGMQVNF